MKLKEIVFKPSDQAKENHQRSQLMKKMLLKVHFAVEQSDMQWIYLIADVYGADVLKEVAWSLGAMLYSHILNGGRYYSSSPDPTQIRQWMEGGKTMDLIKAYYDVLYNSKLKVVLQQHGADIWSDAQELCKKVPLEDLQAVCTDNAPAFDKPFKEITDEESETYWDGLKGYRIKQLTIFFRKYKHLLKG